MPLSDHLRVKQFPLTAQPGLSSRLQFVSATVKYDQLKGCLEDGGEPDPE
jgi:hypothetical protein